MKSPVDGATRRSLLRTIGAGVVATSVVAGSASAQESEVTERFEFNGVTSGWEGLAPSSIEGTTNPTLSLEAGSTYEFYWENGDGAPHNVVIEDADGNNIVESEYVSSEGETQTVEFTASEEMDSYYCGAHPSSMRGDVELSGGSESTATGTDAGTETEDGTSTGTETEAGTGTGTETEAGGDGGNETATDEPTPTATADEQVTTAAPDEQDDTTEANGPGFTVAGALSAIGAGALLRAYRNRDE